MTKTINLLAPSLDIEKGFSIGFRKERDVITLTFEDYRLNSLTKEPRDGDLFTITYEILNVKLDSKDFKNGLEWLPKVGTSLQFYIRKVIGRITNQSIIVHMKAVSYVYGYEISYIGKLTFVNDELIYERLADATNTWCPHKFTKCYYIADIMVDESTYSKFIHFAKVSKDPMPLG
jgi:hypothetical protein